ncbi:putative signal peptide protein, partial [Puccinia sorghi]
MFLGGLIRQKGVLLLILFTACECCQGVLTNLGSPNIHFISLDFAKQQFLPLTDIHSFPVHLVNSSKEPSFWVLKKTKWTFHFSNFPS